MAGPVLVDDLRAGLGAQVMYRRYLGVAEAIVAEADTLWFVVVREA